MEEIKKIITKTEKQLEDLVDLINKTHQNISVLYKLALDNKNFHTNDLWFIKYLDEIFKIISISTALKECKNVKNKLEKASE